MLTEAIVLILVGLLALLLPMSKTYRSRLTVALQRRAEVRLPGAQERSLENRIVRRARGAGAGISLAGIVVLLVGQLWDGSHGMAGGTFIVLASFIGGAAGLSVVESWWPGTVGDGPRAARVTVPSVRDYLPRPVRILAGAITGLGLAALIATLLLARTSWFDTATIVRSPAPVLAVALPVVAMLFGLAIRRVLDSPQPARDSTELYWQDAVRAQTLSFLVVPTPLLSLLGLVILGAVLDDAASATAVATGTVGPAWTLAVLVGAYLLPAVLAVLALLVAARPWGASEMRHFRERLWGGRPPGLATGQVG